MHEAAEDDHQVNNDQSARKRRYNTPASGCVLASSGSGIGLAGHRGVTLRPSQKRWIKSERVKVSTQQPHHFVRRRWQKYLGRYTVIAASTSGSGPPIDKRKKALATFGFINGRTVEFSSRRRAAFVRLLPATANAIDDANQYQEGNRCIGSICASQIKPNHRLSVVEHYGNGFGYRARGTEQQDDASANHLKGGNNGRMDSARNQRRRANHQSQKARRRACSVAGVGRHQQRQEQNSAGTTTSCPPNSRAPDLCRKSPTPGSNRHQIHQSALIKMPPTGKKMKAVIRQTINPTAPLTKRSPPINSVAMVLVMV